MTDEEELERTDEEIRREAWADFVEWVQGLPEQTQALMERFPPMSTVKTKPGIVLLIPGPDVEGQVVSWGEEVSGDMTIGVVAPVTIPHPEHGFGSTRPGEMVQAMVETEMLELVRCEVFRVIDVQAARAGSVAPPDQGD